jgi:hypothetical protein
MSIPVTLPDLNFPSVSPIPSNALLHINIGLTDFKATLAQIQAIDMTSLSAIAQVENTDLMMVMKAGGATPTGKVYVQQVGFGIGIKMWFYTDTIPNTSWQALAISDALLAIKNTSGSGAYYTTGGSTSGIWQQENVANGNIIGGINIDQIPRHNHTYSGGPSGLAELRILYESTQSGSTLTSSSVGGRSSDGLANPHNHGNTWRPLAAVGILCIKVS